MRLLFEFARAHWLYSALLLLGMLVTGALEGLGLSSVLPLASLLIDGAADDPSGITTFVLGGFHRIGVEPSLGALLTGITLAFAGKAGLLLLVRRELGYAVARKVTELRLKLLRALLAADWRFYIERPIGAFGNAFTTEAERVGTAYLQATWVAFHSIQLAIYIAIAFAASWRVTLVALGFGVLLAFALGGLVRAGRRGGQRQTKLARSMLSRLTDLLQGVKPLKAMGRADAMAPLLERDATRMERALQKQILAKEGLAALQEPLVIAIVAGGFLFGVSLAGMDVPRVLLLAVLVERGYSALNKAQKRYQKVAIHESAYWSLCRSIEDAEHRAEALARGAAPELREQVELDGVTVRYGDNAVLSDLSLSAAAGRITALTGPSGGGKTTIVDLIVGLIRPDAGCVRIDGVPLDSIDLAAWRRSVGYVGQDPFLLHDTVSVNVSLGDPDLGPADVERALRRAHAWDFVQQMPKGLDTMVGERGMALSGGQRQRIAIARALVTRPRLLILDEATASLDPASEAAVLDALLELRGETTVVAVSHQPALLEIADRAYHVENGRAMERLLSQAGARIGAGAGSRP